MIPNPMPHQKCKQSTGQLSLLVQKISGKMSIFEMSRSVYINTEHVFALASLLGFRFAPRISDALSKKLYVPGEVNVSGALSTLVCEQVNTKLIREQWD